MPLNDETAAADEVTTRPLRRDAARNRAALIDSARVVFAERGLDASLDDVAHHAGVGVGTAYRHFANKYDLARAIFTEAIADIVNLAETAGKSTDAWDGIVIFLQGVAARQTADRGLREVLMGVHDPDRMAQVSDRIEGPLIDLVQRAKAAGQMRPDAADTDIGLVVLMLCTVADATADVAPDLWRRYLPMLLDSLRAGAATPLPVPAIDSSQLREALSNHKQRIHGSGDTC